MELQCFLCELLFLVSVGLASSEISENGKLSCKEEAEKINNMGLVGAFTPTCQPDGYYAPLQCHGSTGICWCVNKYGEKVPDGSIKKTKCGNPCFKRILDNPPPTLLLQGAPHPIPFDAPVPDCDADGFFKPRQCNSKECWCVDKHGNEFKNTRGDTDDIVCQ